jgi:hypothetical protein
MPDPRLELELAAAFARFMLEQNEMFDFRLEL